MFIVCCLLSFICGFTPVEGKGDVDLKGTTLRISNGDVSMFDGRVVCNGTIVVSEGDYLVRVKKEGGTCLKLGDNMEFIVNGSIRLAPNDFKKYSIVTVVGSHVRIHGKGSIVGDKISHTGKEGEWGMGINFRGASDATLSDLTVKDCWGDCVYVGGESKNIKINNCVLSDSRRQGVSITKADSVTVNNCSISNISGTMPQYAIDIEPNRNCTVNYVLIENVEATNCEGGFRATVPNAAVENAAIGTVEIRNCRVSALSRYPIHLNRCHTCTVAKCTIGATNDRPCVYANYVEDLKVCNNTLNVDVQLLSSIKNKVKKLVGKSDYSAIRVVHGSAKGVRNNKIIEK